MEDWLDCCLRSSSASDATYFHLKSLKIPLKAFKSHRKPLENRSKSSRRPGEHAVLQGHKAGGGVRVEGDARAVHAEDEGEAVGPPKGVERDPRRLLLGLYTYFERNS